MDGSNLLQFDNLSQLIYILKQHLTADYITNNLFFNQIIKYFFMFRQHYHVCLNCAHTTCFGYMEPGCFVWAV